MEFMDILDQAQDVREDLNANYDVAQRKLNMARAMEGDVAVRGAAAALKEHPEITTQSKNIMGSWSRRSNPRKSAKIPRRARGTDCSARQLGSTRPPTPTRNCSKRSSPRRRGRNGDEEDAQGN